MRRVALALLAAALFSAPALADGVGPAPKPAIGEVTPAALFAKEKTCQAVSDGCQACKRTPNGFTCSTPGIACVPGVYSCREKAAP